MPNDPSQDKDFLAASPADQHAYLMATDQDYAKASPVDQQAYLAHLTGKQAQSQTQSAPIQDNAVVRAEPKPFSKEWLKNKFYSNIAGPFTEALPAAGATVGGIAGFGGGGPVGAVGGAGIGGMGGEAGKQLLQRWMGIGNAPQTPNEAAKRIMFQGGTQGAIQGVTEGMGALAGPLQRAATSQYERALAPTTRINKAITQKITPELIQRGEYGTLGGLETRAGQQAADIRPQLDAAYAATPTSATAGSGAKILQDLESLKGRYIVQGQAANPQAVNAISGVQDIVRQYGPDIDPNSLRQLKQIFDEPVAQRGGFGGGDLTTAYTLKAQRAAGNSIRGIMEQANPDVASLNREISFWLDVQRVTSQSGLRRTGQEGGLMKVLSPMAGAVAGAAGYAGGGARVGLETAGAAALTTLAIQVSRSPLWRTASAVAKSKFADALARGSVGEATALASRFGVTALQKSLQGAPQPQQANQQSAGSLPFLQRTQ